MLDEIHFHDAPDGTSKELICFNGVKNGTEALDFFKRLVDTAAAKGKYISNIDNSETISPDTGGNPGWGMSISNKAREKALFTFVPTTTPVPISDNEHRLRAALCELVGATTPKELKEMETAIRAIPGNLEDKRTALNAIQTLLTTL